MRPWPFPGEDSTARARRVALAYRQRFLQLDPEACAALDTVMCELGEAWAVPRLIAVDPDDWLSASDAAELAMVNLPTLRQWRRRGRLSGRQRSARRWEYQAREVIALASMTRTRGRNEGTQD